MGKEGEMAKQRYDRLGMFRAATAAALASLLAACASGSSDPAPVVMKGAGPAEASVTTAPQRTADRYIVVRPGQQLGRIAEAYRVPKRTIIAANHLQPPYKLAMGQRLLIPGSGTTAPPPQQI